MVKLKVYCSTKYLINETLVFCNGEQAAYNQWNINHKFSGYVD